MARQVYRPSVLDRLLGEGREPESGASFEEIRESIRRDLESLFNTRQGRDDIPDEYRELSGSIAAYGLRNFSGTDLESSTERQRLLRAIERCVRLYEPRLDRIEVREVDDPRPFELSFRIHAVLTVAGIEDRVVFGTRVRRDGGAVVEDT